MSTADNDIRLSNDGGTITLHERRVPYAIKRFPRQRSIKVHIRGAGILVTAARSTPLRAMSDVIRSHSKWIVEHISAPSYPVTIDAGVVAALTERLIIRIEDRLYDFNGHYRLTYQKVSVRNQKTRWGSCSTDGNLSFNIHMISLPDTLFDYVIVHELCHLAEMNHSPAFWRLVEEMIPDYRERRRALREHRL